MELPKVNLLEQRPTRSRRGRGAGSAARHLISPLTVAVVFALSFLLGRVSLTEAASYSFLDRLPIIGTVSSLITSPDRVLVGEAEDRINVLLVGMGGEGHDGANLTDTIILASYRPSDGRVAMLSVPRDLLVPVPGHGWRKINSVNAFGELNSPGRGGDLTRTTMEGLLGIDIPYYVRIDFQGFRQIIDSIGGLDIYVERGFTDYSYPTYNHGVQVVSFDEGWTHMNGESALQYARSRHGNHGEGSDFARSRRQQKVLSALKEKMLSYKTFSSPSTITNTLAALKANIATNLDVGEILRLSRLARSVERDDIRHTILDNSPGSILVDSVVYGAYVLLPKKGDWNALREVATDMLGEPAEPEDAVLAEAEGEETSETPAAPPELVSALVELQNGSGQAGVARDLSSQLKNAGFKIAKIGNADSFDYGTTLVYDLTDGSLISALKRLRQQLPDAEMMAARGTQVPPHSDSADFLIIIGRD
ncbi:LCP family protein [Patescibacteria group bacterium]